MRMRSIRIAVLGLGVVAALALLAGCGSSKTHGAEGTLKLTEPGGNTSSFGVIGKASEKGISPGNGLAFSSPLQNSEKKTVGEINAFCIATQPSGENLNGTCSATATVPGGTFALNLGGKSIGNGTHNGAIVGGTGKYNGALGTFSSAKNGGGEHPSETVTFSYTLP
jgi:hypothetical protein